MTWCAKFTDQDGNVPGDGYCACMTCKHNDICNLKKVHDVVGSLLTSVDTHCGDGSKWANGEAVLKCGGYEPKETEGGDNTGAEEKPE